MTPHRDTGRGSYLIDRMCGKLGRLKLASGTTDAAEFAGINAMITKLKRERRWDLLSLLAQRLVSPLELYDAVFRGALHTLPSAEDLRPLTRSIERWLAIADVAPRTRADYAKLLTYPPGTHLAALPQLLTDARIAALQSGKRQSFNNQLTAARAFVRDTLPTDHQLRKAVHELAPLPVTHRAGNPQEPDEIRALAVHFPYVDELWALCLTAMRQSEYWGQWTVGADRVTIAGAKGPRGAPLPRVVPLVYRPAAPRVAYSTFYKALVRESGGALNVHDLRKTAQRWWEDAGVADWRISLYAGHARGRTQLATVYRRPRDLTRLLVEDAERVRTWLGEPPKVGLRVASA